ncbi:uncharacterized protein LOC132048963 [Lycium ferocissimum]|uniref:uncharacterized protein LOC132048963 n=1 Tax=Lycium ferocissimum TaxID=112874 RepID=UPI0028153645|nr:uncharacterized protein LOC132048963 [Lycium ferocissimum]
MATVRVFSITIVFAILFVQQCICTDSPAPAPESGADVASSPPESPAPSPLSNLTSPPAPPPSDLPSDSSPAPSPVNDGTAFNIFSYIPSVNFYSSHFAHFAFRVAIILLINDSIIVVLPLLHTATSKDSPSPAPAPNSEVASDISHESAEDSKESSSGGMTSGKKAGIAVGVIAAVCFVGLGALVYKKRQQNIQRTQFGYDARREIL